ncbi:MAG: D-tyrosyl-tRNA(Tyr) deacylase [Candidatus Izimaplasma sp.]|nr:D-tyrosyl-tRNA(Tyr) deacylase [Candidatus Izimaplasma bacterium]
MRVLVQRVLRASVIVNGKEYNKINQGYLLFVGLNNQDKLEDLDYCARKVAKLRIFTDDNDLMNLDINKINGEILSISQFTLYGDVKKQNRPGFTDAMEFNKAKLMYKEFNEILKNKYNLKVYDGVFGENMEISLVNDGPVTILIDTEK